MDAQTNQVVGLIVALVMAGISWIIIARRERQLDDPNDKSVVHLHQLTEISMLQVGGKYLLRTIRQSGNLYKDDQIFDCHLEAINAAATTFKRAKIEYAFVTKNSEVELFFRRPYHHHGGKAEGKKVGVIEIYKIE